MTTSRKSLLRNRQIVIIMTRVYLALVNNTSINKPTLKATITENNSHTGKKDSLAHPEQGFTLTEVIVTTLVLAIIATIAVPAILTQLANMEAKRVRHTLMNTFTSAKVESYIRRQNLLVCLSNSGGRCNKESSKNLLLFIDKNDNKHFDSDTDHLLSEQHLDPKYGTLHLRAGRRHYVRFYGDSGKPRGHFGHIKYCPSKTYSQSMYQVSFNQGGIIKYKPNSIHDTGCAG